MEGGLLKTMPLPLPLPLPLLVPVPPPPAPSIVGNDDAEDSRGDGL